MRKFLKQLKAELSDKKFKDELATIILINTRIMAILYLIRFSIMMFHNHEIVNSIGAVLAIIGLLIQRKTNRSK